MKKLILIAAIAILAGSYCAYTAEPVPGIAPETPKSYLTGLSVSPYYTVAFENFDGKSRGGAGLEAALPLSKTASLVAYAEGDKWQHAAIDRTGAAIQINGKLGAIRPFGRIGFGYAFDSGSGIEENDLYLRPQFGAIWPIYENGDFSAGLTASWALDVSLDGKTAQRLFGGLGLNYKF